MPPLGQAVCSVRTSAVPSSPLGPSPRPALGPLGSLREGARRDGLVIATLSKAAPRALRGLAFSPAPSPVQLRSFPPDTLASDSRSPLGNDALPPPSAPQTLALKFRLYFSPAFSTVASSGCPASLQHAPLTLVHAVDTAFLLKPKSSVCPLSPERLPDGPSSPFLVWIGRGSPHPAASPLSQVLCSVH